MKKTTIKIFSVLCAVCMLLSIGATAFAAESPSVTAKLNKSGKKAEILLNDIGVTIYSAQVTLRINGEDMEFTVTPTDSSAYGTVTTANGTVTLYVDSKNLADGSGTLSLATLSADKKMTIGRSADLILVDRGMSSVSYENVPVKIIETEDSNEKGSNDSSSKRTSGNSGSILTDNEIIAAPSVSFTDISTHWAKDDITYVTSLGLFEGTSATTFEPGALMTRAMYVTVLSRFGDKLGEKWKIACENPLKFADVADGEWYSDAIAWAGGIGLVNGIEKDIFAPTDPITREQLAIMTVNFAKICGMTIPANEKQITFADDDDIHDWAADAVRIAQTAGLINGRENGKFEPRETATRAEVSAILHRFVEIFN